MYFFKCMTSKCYSRLGLPLFASAEFTASPVEPSRCDLLWSDPGIRIGNCVSSEIKVTYGMPHYMVYNRTNINRSNTQPFQKTHVEIWPLHPNAHSLLKSAFTKLYYWLFESWTSYFDYRLGSDFRQQTVLQESHRRNHCKKDSQCLASSKVCPVNSEILALWKLCLCRLYVHIWNTLAVIGSHSTLFSRKNREDSRNVQIRASSAMFIKIVLNDDHLDLNPLVNKSITH
jgi:hypothetical protein